MEATKRLLQHRFGPGRPVLELPRGQPALIRIRRVASRIPFTRLYEVETTPHGWREFARQQVTRAPNAVLEPILGGGDAWSFVKEADRQRATGRGQSSSRRRSASDVMLVR